MTMPNNPLLAKAPWYAPTAGSVPESETPRDEQPRQEKHEHFFIRTCSVIETPTQNSANQPGDEIQDCSCGLRRRMIRERNGDTRFEMVEPGRNSFANSIFDKKQLDTIGAVEAALKALA